MSNEWSMKILIQFGVITGFKGAPGYRHIFWKHPWKKRRNERSINILIQFGVITGFKGAPGYRHIFWKHPWKKRRNECSMNILIQFAVITGFKGALGHWHIFLKWPHKEACYHCMPVQDSVWPLGTDIRKSIFRNHHLKPLWSCDRGGQLFQIIKTKAFL